MTQDIALVLLLWAATASAGDSLAPGAMVEIQGPVPVFENPDRQLYEKPVYTLEKGEWVELGESRGDLVKLSFKGRSGWVERSRLDFRPGGQYIKMEEMAIKGWLDNPQAVYILDFTDTGGKGLRLERSFIYDDPTCMENIVKAEFEMENELYYFKPIPLNR